MNDDSELQAILEDFYDNSIHAYHAFMGTYTDAVSDETAPDRVFYEAVTALHKWRRDSVLAMLPEKLQPRSDFTSQMKFQLQGYNQAIDQMKQAIGEGRSYDNK